MVKINSELTKAVAIIADKSTTIGFRIAGVQVTRIIDDITKPDVLESTIDEILNNPEIGFIIITEPLVEAYGLYKFEKLRKIISEQVIIIIIPDREGTKREIGESHLFQIIRKAIGTKRTV